MSEYPNVPPPFPQQAMPVEPVGYYQSASVARPAIITAMGVMSVVVGSLGIFVSGLMALWGFGMSMAAVSMRSMSTAGVSSSTSMVSPASASASQADDVGLSVDDRQIVIRGLEQSRRLDERRRRQLDELLAEHGKDIIDMKGADLTAVLISAGVSSSGRLPSSDGGDDGADFYVLGRGRIELWDEHAAFFPNDGEPAVRSVATEMTGGTGAVAAVVMPSGLSAEDIRSVIRRVRQLGGRLNSAQIKMLTQTLSATGEQLVIPTTDQSSPALEVRSAISITGGTVVITTLHGVSSSSISLDAAGNVSSSTYTSTGGVGVRTATTKLNVLWPVMATVGILLQFALAIYLLICGILVLRQSHRGARLHWIYLSIKLPLAIAAGAVTGWAVSEFFGSLVSGVRNGSLIFLASLVPFAVGCIYPIALIFVLRRPTVREYYLSGQ